MINSDYKRIYQGLFRELLDSEGQGELDSCAIPSYTHPNRLMSWLFWKRISTAMSLCPDIRRKRVLDFGCGAGVCFKFLCERGCEVIACDSQYHLIAARVARALGLSVLTYSSIEQLPKGPYDYIMALDVLEHVEDLAYIVGRFKEMCHSSTRIIVSGPTENLFYKFGRFLAGFSGHYHCRSIYDIERTLIDSGYALNTLERLFRGVQLFRISSWSLAGDTR